MPFSFSLRWQDQEHTPNPLSEALEARRKSGRPIFDLTTSNPTHCGIAIPENWTSFLNQASLSEMAQYDPQPQGSLQAREAIAQYYAERGVPIDPSDLFLTSGTSEGYSHLFKLLCDPGDEILVPSPSYPLLETLASLNDIQLKPYSLVCGSSENGFVPWQLDRASLESAFTEKTRALIIVSPNNPTGSVLSNDDAEYLQTFASDRGITLIIDEVFADYCDPLTPNGGNLFSPIGGQGATPLLFTLNGLSKILGLPQLKLAWIRIDGDPALKTPAKSHLVWICDAYLSVNGASQAACPELLRRRVEFQNPIKQRLEENLSTLREFAKTNPRVEPLWPQGGWCIPIRCVDVEDDEEFALTLLRDHGVRVHPGYFFDFAEDNIIVISLLILPEIFREGLKRLSE